DTRLQIGPCKFAYFVGTGWNCSSEQCSEPEHSFRSTLQSLKYFLRSMATTCDSLPAESSSSTPFVPEPSILFCSIFLFPGSMDMKSSIASEQSMDRSELLTWWNSRRSNCRGGL